MENKDDPVAYTDENGEKFVKDFRGQWVPVRCDSTHDGLRCGRSYGHEGPTHEYGGRSWRE